MPVQKEELLHLIHNDKALQWIDDRVYFKTIILSVSKVWKSCYLIVGIFWLYQSAQIWSVILWEGNSFLEEFLIVEHIWQQELHIFGSKTSKSFKTIDAYIVNQEV